MKKIELTIIVPAYNVETYLRSCLDSILMQQYTDYELIIVDDASKDRTRSIIEEYKEKDSRIKTIFFDTNKGPSDARQSALDMSDGTYIMFIDADDRYSTDTALGLMIDAMKTSGADCVSCRYQIDHGKRMIKKQGYNRVNQLMTKNEFALLKLKIPEFHWHYLVIRCYKSKLIKENNIRFDSGLLFREDMKFNNDYMRYAQSYYFIKDYLYVYNRTNGQSITRTQYIATLDRQKGLYTKAKEQNNYLIDLYTNLGLYQECKKEIAEILYVDALRLIRSFKKGPQQNSLSDYIKNDSNYIDSVSILGSYAYIICAFTYLNKRLNHLKKVLIKVGNTNITFK